MADSRFFEKAGPFTLAALAELVGADLQNGNPDAVVSDVEALQTAGAEHISFLENKLYVDAFTKSAAGACLVDAAYVARAPEGMALLVTNEPRSEEHTSELQSPMYLVCRLLLEKTKNELTDRSGL